MTAKTKLTDDQVDEIRARHAADPAITKAAFAREFGVDPSTISRVLNGKTFAGAPAVQSVPWAQLHTTAANPRSRVDNIQSLAKSIKSRGVLQPLIVRPIAHPPGHYQIVAGERRFHAIGALVQSGDVKETYSVPVIIRDIGDADALIDALVENLARDDMHPLDEAHAYVRAGDAGVDTADLAAAVGRTRRHVQARIRLIKRLTDDARDALTEGQISLAQAEALTKGDAAAQAFILRDLDRYRTEQDILDELARIKDPNQTPIGDQDEATAEPAAKQRGRWEKLNLVTQAKSDQIRCTSCGHTTWCATVPWLDDCPKCHSHGVQVENPVYGTWTPPDNLGTCVHCNGPLIEVPRQGHPNSPYWELQRNDGQILVACAAGCPEDGNPCPAIPPTFQRTDGQTDIEDAAGAGETNAVRRSVSSRDLADALKTVVPDDTFKPTDRTRGISDVEIGNRLRRRMKACNGGGLDRPWHATDPERLRLWVSWDRPGCNYEAGTSDVETEPTIQCGELVALARDVWHLPAPKDETDQADTLSAETLRISRDVKKRFEFTGTLSSGITGPLPLKIWIHDKETGREAVFVREDQVETKSSPARTP